MRPHYTKEDIFVRQKPEESSIENIENNIETAEKINIKSQYSKKDIEGLSI